MNTTIKTTNVENETAKNKLVKLQAIIRSEVAQTKLSGSDFLEIELKAFNGSQTIGHITLDILNDAYDKPAQYILKWYPDGIDDENECYTDPVILKEGHKDEGEIQCVREK